YIQHVKEASLKTPTNTAAVEMFNVLSLGDVSPILAKLDKPTLYIYEPNLESQAKLIQSKLPTARVEVFKAGHAMFVDDPDHFNKVVADFINSLPQNQNN
ncbi:MAG: alpha/beta hydrolase, partial [Candidatus Acidiferrum sp.]